MLIDRCLCGLYEPFPRLIGGMWVARCGCGVQWLMSELKPEAILEYYRTGAYHCSADRHEAVVPYSARYATDAAAARARLAAYRKRIPLDHGRFRALDVGAANGAFVDELRRDGHDAIGVELDPAFARPPHVVTGDVTRWGPKSFDLVTYHDVLEHVADPRAELELARERIKPHGYLVVEVPDVHVLGGAKHYKLEHLWYFTLRSLVDLIHSVNLEFITCDLPIPGKLVAYAYART